MAMKILLVGSGITSAATGAFLRKKFLDQVRIIVWDKAKGIGGRMSTSRSPRDSSCLADLGAQYVTTTQENLAKYQEVYSPMLLKGLLETLRAHTEGLNNFPPEISHFVAPGGMSSLVKHLFVDVADEMKFNHHVCSITEQGRGWKVETKSGVVEIFDIVVLTMPIPQILQLSGSITDIVEKDSVLKNGLNATTYSSRYALGLFYNNESHGPKMPCDIKYVSDDEIVRYISFDNRKRNRLDEPTAIVLHTSTSFGEKNVERTTDEVEPQLIDHIQKFFPQWSQPDFVKCHKWRYSQVTTPYPGTLGYVCLQNQPLLIAGGDGFTRSNFDGCISSAFQLTERVIKHIVDSKIGS